MIPIRDNILLSPIAKENMFGDLLIVGELDNTRRAMVLKVGKDVKEVQVGDTVLYYEGQGLKLTEDRKDYVLIREGELSLILD